MRALEVRVNGTAKLVTETCYSCGVLFAMGEEFWKACQDKGPSKSFYCPNGHSQHYVTRSTADQLADAKARETALRDQLTAANRAAEAARSELARVSFRIACGVCPACTRSFDDVRRHIQHEHPDFGPPPRATKRLVCSCGGSFDTYHGLRVHQGRLRKGIDWASPKTSSYRAHLTEVSSR